MKTDVTSVVRVHKWKCPQCGRWIREEMGKVCKGCKNEEAGRLGQDRD